MEYVGIPYKKQGINPEEGLDCYGIVRYVLGTEKGLILPEEPPPPTAWNNYVKVFRPPLPQLLKYDVIMLAEVIEGITNHIGIMITTTDFLHAGSKFGGVVCEPVSKYSYAILAIGRPRDN